MSIIDVGKLTELFEELHRRNRYDEIVKRSRSALASEPDEPRLWTWLSYGLRKLGRTEESLEAAERACGYDGASAWPHVIRSWCLVTLHRSREAHEAAERAVELEPGDTFSLVQLSRTSRKVGQLEAARQLAERARDIDPGDTDVWDAIAYHASEDCRFADAEAACRKALELEPDSAYFHNALGSYLNQQSRTDEALDQFRRAIACDLRFRRAHRNLAVVLEARDQFDDAQRVLRNAIEAFPDDASFSGELTDFLRRRGRSAEALLAAQTTAEKHPSRSESWISLAWCHDALDHEDDAVQAALKAVEISPTSAAARQCCCNILVNARRAEEAVIHGRLATEAMPGEMAGWKALATAACQAGYEDEAIAAAERAVVLSNGNAGAWGKLAEVAVYFGRRERAMEALQRRAELSPDDEGTWELYAWIALHAESAEGLELARSQIERLRRGVTRTRGPERRPYLLHEIEGGIHALAGRWDAAREALETALETTNKDLCSPTCLLGVSLVHLGRRKEAERIARRERVGSNAHGLRCRSPVCLDGKKLDRALSVG